MTWHPETLTKTDEFIVHFDLLLSWNILIRRCLLLQILTRSSAVILRIEEFLQYFVHVQSFYSFCLVRSIWIVSWVGFELESISVQFYTKSLNSGYNVITYMWCLDLLVWDIACGRWWDCSLVSFHEQFGTGETVKAPSLLFLISIHSSLLLD